MDTVNSTMTPNPVVILSVFDGPFYGTLIAFVLFGVSIVQTWTYLNTNHDKWFFRLFVGALVMLDFASNCLGAQVLHYYLVSNFGNISAFATFPPMQCIENIITIAIISGVEMFFAFRVYQIGKIHWVVPMLIVLSALGAMSSGIVINVGQLRDPSVGSLESLHQKLPTAIDASFAVFSDIVATVALSWTFSQSKTGIRRTDTLLQKLLQYTVTRGFFVTVSQTAFLLLILIRPEKFWWSPFLINLSKIYVITFLSMLNSRESLRNLTGSGIITDSEMLSRGSVPDGHSRKYILKDTTGIGSGSLIEMSVYKQKEGLVRDERMPPQAF